jgi:hypothetical protein
MLGLFIQKRGMPPWEKWRRGWDSNSRKTVLSHVIRCYKITVSKALSWITQNHQASCGEKHAQIPPCYVANVAQKTFKFPPIHVFAVLYLLVDGFRNMPENDDMTGKKLDFSSEEMFTITSQGTRERYWWAKHCGPMIWED